MRMQMQAWRIEDTSTGAIALGASPVPDPGPGEVLVRVRAAALNFSDLLMAKGRYQVRPPLPFTPGQEIAGAVERCGAGVSIAKGQRVAGKVLWGGFAERAILRADMAISLPDDLPFAEAATLPVVYPTSHIALHDRAQLQAGETVLVHAAAGGVGMAALQLAVAHGARVIATAGGAEKLDFCRSRGAFAAFDYREENWLEEVKAASGGKGVDVVFDPVGGAVADASLKCLAWRGRYLVVGFASGQIPELKANRLLLKNAAALGVYWSHDIETGPIERAVSECLALWRAGRLVFDVGARYPFAELGRALEDLGARRTTGKSILMLED